MFYKTQELMCLLFLANIGPQSGRELKQIFL